MSKFLVTALFVIGANALSIELISQETILNQEKQTSRLTLNNGIALTVRDLPESDIMAISVVFRSGYKDHDPKNKILGQLVTSMMSTATENFPREKLRKVKEKYAIRIGCSEGVDYSSCSMSGVADYWEQAVALLGDMVVSPAFTEDDFELEKAKLKASLESTPSSPSSFVNDVVNTVFYPEGHPYKSDYKQALVHLENTKLSDLVEFHRKRFALGNVSIVFVGNMKHEKLVADLNQHMQFKTKADIVEASVSDPEYQPNQRYAFEHRDIPSAYLRLKFNMPTVTSLDMMPISLLLSYLSQELSSEIRTNLSLSYATHAGGAAMSIGIGVISSSTSKPKEVLEAMSRVIGQVKNKKFTNEELDEYKVAYITDYYLGLETHNSLMAGLVRSLYYTGTTDLSYRTPEKLQAVTPEDISRVAKKYLRDFRMGVIYHKDKFKKEWADKIMDEYSKK